MIVLVQMLLTEIYGTVLLTVTSLGSTYSFTQCISVLHGLRVLNSMWGKWVISFMEGLEPMLVQYDAKIFGKMLVDILISHAIMVCRVCKSMY